MPCGSGISSSTGLRTWAGGHQRTEPITRLTNAFSKKLENLKAACALHFAHYNFCRVHQTLRVTPAMEAGIANHVWSIQEIVDLLNTVKVRNAA